MLRARTPLFLATVAALMGLAATAQAASTWYVAPPPTGSDTQAGTFTAPFATIQHAINAAAAGDTINVGPGTYGESLTWDSKDLTILGTGAASTVIDPTYGATPPGGRCLYTDGLSPASYLDGFTLRHGGPVNDNGGGMYNLHSSPSIANCTFAANSATYNGGGMYNNSLCSPSVTNCTFTANSAASGGGMYNTSSSPSVANCAFSGNSARLGGGMVNAGGSPSVANCTFSGNLGGGMLNKLNSSPSVTNCTFAANPALFLGGGMANVSSSTTVTNCIFTANSAAYGSAGGMYNYQSTTSATNCILWGDAGAEISSDVSGTPTVTYSDVAGASGVYSGTGNLNVDPLFVRNPTIYLNSDGTVNLSTSDFGDLRLQAASPCIDAGNSAVVTAANGFLMDPTNTYFIDLAGNPRISGTAVDMGAYEFQSVLLQAEAQVQTLMNDVKAMVNGGVALPANGQPLYAKLDAPVAYLQAGDTADAASVLQAFINQVNAFVKTGKLTPTQGQALISQAQAIITLLGG